MFYKMKIDLCYKPEINLSCKLFFLTGMKISRVYLFKSIPQINLSLYCVYKSTFKKKRQKFSE